MNRSLGETLLYHQIHPLRLAVTTVAGTYGLILLSRHALVAGTAVIALPTAVATLWLLRRGNFERQRRSAIGRHVRRWMTPFAYAERFVGFALMCFAAWSHSYPLMAFGVAFIVHAWTAGLLIGKR